MKNLHFDLKIKKKGKEKDQVVPRLKTAGGVKNI